MIMSGTSHIPQYGIYTEFAAFRQDFAIFILYDRTMAHINRIFCQAES